MKRILLFSLVAALVLSLAGCTTLLPRGQAQEKKEPATESQNESELIIVNPQVPIPGVYRTNDWNGEEAELVLYEDGTCLYPNGAEGTWISKGEGKIKITLIVDDALIEKAIHTAYVTEEGILLHDSLFKREKRLIEGNAI